MLLFKYLIMFQTDRSQWRIVFIISSAMFLLSNIFYVIFASGEVQWWNDGYTNKNIVCDEKKKNDEKVLRTF